MDLAKLNNYIDGNTAQEVALYDSFSLERYAQFARHLPRQAVDVLDVGCAEGRGGARLKELRPELALFGLDCVPSRLAALPSAYKKGIEGLTTSIPLADQSLDAVVAGEFLEHLYPADVEPTLCEFQRILRVGGMLLLTTPNPQSLRLRLRKGTVFEVGHLTQHFRDALTFRLRMHGFRHIRAFGSGKATRYLGEHVPLLFLYGSYLLTATKY